jgi:hypothetical protein
VPENSTKALIILAFNGYGKCLYDDVNLFQKDGDSAISIIINNPSFEYTLQFDHNN